MKIILLSIFCLFLLYSCDEYKHSHNQNYNKIKKGIECLKN